MGPGLPEKRVRAKGPGRCAKSGAGQAKIWAGPGRGRGGGWRACVFVCARACVCACV